MDFKFYILVLWLLLVMRGDIIMSYEKLNNEELSKILGGNGINWGAVVGSCASGAVIGAAFGNPLTGYVANSAFSFSWQPFKNRPRPKKMDICQR